MIKPWRRTPRYHFGPILLICTSLNPAFVNHSMYSSSFGKSIHMSAKKRDNQYVGYTGPIKHAFPPIFRTRYASLMPRCGSGQYSMLQQNMHRTRKSKILHKVKIFQLVTKTSYKYSKNKVLLIHLTFSLSVW